MLGTVLAVGALVKFTGAVGCLGGAYGLYYTLPEKVIKRKLDYVFRMGHMFMTIEGYKGKIIKRYPSVSEKNIRKFSDRIEATFMIPVGFDPKKVSENEALFRQSFGEETSIELSRDCKKFHLVSYSKVIDKFNYDPQEVQEAMKDISLPIYLGRDRSGPIVYNMVEHPHLLYL